MCAWSIVIIQNLKIQKNIKHLESVHIFDDLLHKNLEEYFIVCHTCRAVLSLFLFAIVFFEKQLAEFKQNFKFTTKFTNNEVSNFSNFTSYNNNFYKLQKTFQILFQSFQNLQVTNFSNFQLFKFLQVTFQLFKFYKLQIFQILQVTSILPTPIYKLPLSKYLHFHFFEHFRKLFNHNCQKVSHHFNIL